MYVHVFCVFWFVMKIHLLCICLSLEWKFFSEKEKVVYEETSTSVCTACLGGGFTRKFVGSCKQQNLFLLL